MPRTGGTGGGGGIQFLHGLSFGLYIQAKLNPQVWDAIPQVVRYSRGTLNVIGAQIIKAVAFAINDVSLYKELNTLGSKLYSAGTKTMDYDDDWFCGNGVIPIPHRFITTNFLNPSEVDINPQPQPPRSYYGAIILIVAESIDDEAIANSLKSIGNSLTK